MSPELIAAAVRLADVLRAENEALARLDLPAASSLLDGKQAAAAAFARLAGTAPDRPASAEAREIAARLRDLAQDNQRLLERAMQVQNRVLGTITRAAAASAARAAPRYGRSGTMTPSRGGCALTAQA